MFLENAFKTINSFRDSPLNYIATCISNFYTTKTIKHS